MPASTGPAGRTAPARPERSAELARRRGRRGEHSPACRPTGQPCGPAASPNSQPSGRQAATQPPRSTWTGGPREDQRLLLDRPAGVNVIRTLDGQRRSLMIMCPWGPVPRRDALPRPPAAHRHRGGRGSGGVRPGGCRTLLNRPHSWSRAGGRSGRQPPPGGDTCSALSGPQRPLLAPATARPRQPLEPTFGICAHAADRPGRTLMP